MPKGLKATSGMIVISASVTETANNTFTQATVDLQLNPLDNEVFVVQAIDIDPSSPEVVAGNTTSTLVSVSTTSRTGIGQINDSNVLAAAAKTIVDATVPFSSLTPDSPQGVLDYIGIIATNDMFLQILGANNAAPKTGNVRVWGQRMRADASTYAALVQSEMLSQ